MKISLCNILIELLKVTGKQQHKFSEAWDHFTHTIRGPQSIAPIMFSVIGHLPSSIYGVRGLIVRFVSNN